VISRPGGVLVCRRAAYPPGVLRLPRGPVRPDEPLLEAVRRAALAETGLEARPVRVLAVLAYRERAAGAPPGLPAYHTFALLCDTTGTVSGRGAPAGSEGLPGAPDDFTLRVLPVDGLPTLAETLEHVQDGAVQAWESWGRWRAHVHRAVWSALSGPAI